MAPFFIKNLETYFVIMGFLLAVLIWKVYFSPSMAPAGNEDAKSYIGQEFNEMRFYEVVYSFIIYKLQIVTCLMLFFKPGYLYSFIPFSWKIRNIISYTLDDLAKEVETLLKLKLYLKFILIDAANAHLIEILHTIMTLLIAYITALVKYKVASNEDKKNLGGGVNQNDFLIVLWFWYVSTSLVMICYIGVLISKYKQLRMRQKLKSFSNIEDWLCDICEEDIDELDKRANEVGMDGFRDAAKHLVLDSRINKYAIKEFGYYPPMDDVQPDNSHELLTIKLMIFGKSIVIRIS